ncbi:unnamed protein product [Darwinula stevensoni]|uniref:Uncharacterized protein n=1 Tax=Darwinula stevensoni TaxID=69355 RepID=A0A7R8XER3_9CRUS|nr:unnamed protein product [Darwinula stevensoni]CAG0894713.1 unnamed protein product [Darwinula stevensoni]
MQDDWNLVRDHLTSSRGLKLVSQDKTQTSDILFIPFPTSYRTMIFSRIFSFSILYVVSGMLDQACHTPDILPCTCQADYTIHPSAPKMRVDCSRANTSKEIFSALNNFSITQLWEFRVTNNKKLQELPEGIFGHLSLENIYLNNTGVRTIHPSVILSSKDRLVNMTIEYSLLEEFPFHLLSSLPRLTKLRLPHNSLTSVPAVRTDSLETLNLEYNNISIMEEVGWATPNLRKLSLSGNPISTLPSAMIKNQKKLEEFSCSKCKLGPILSNGQLEFHSKALKDVYLKMNDISRLEPGAITGITSGTRVYLSSNKIAKLDAKSFHGILHVLSQGDGTLALSDNPIRCGCELEWLVRDPELLRKIHGSCENGTVLKALGRDSFKDCRTCPYECVDAQSKNARHRPDELGEKYVSHRFQVCKCRLHRHVRPVQRKPLLIVSFRKASLLLDPGEATLSIDPLLSSFLC